jgi:hypothetical protein
MMVARLSKIRQIAVTVADVERNVIRHSRPRCPTMNSGSDSCAIRTAISWASWKSKK